MNVAKNAEGKICYIEFVEARDNLACHLLDNNNYNYKSVIDGLSPLICQSSYDPELDVLWVTLVDEFEPRSSQFWRNQTDEDYSFILCINDEDRIYAFEVQTASEILGKSIKSTPNS